MSGECVHACGVSCFDSLFCAVEVGVSGKVDIGVRRYIHICCSFILHQVPMYSYQSTKYAAAQRMARALVSCALDAVDCAGAVAFVCVVAITEFTSCQPLCFSFFSC